jgi:fucose 4-O-acetylase-like acetyltransferase
MEKSPEQPLERAAINLKAPFWLLAGIAALIAASVLDAVITLDVLAQYQVLATPFPPGLKIAAAGAWIVVLTVLTVDLLRRRRWAFRWAGPILTLYALAGWVWQFLFDRSDYGRGQLGFQMLVAGIALIPVWWIAVRRGWLRRTDGDG